MPTSQKQQAANRRNALKSTGPKTESGKATSAQNSTKHGATAVIYRPIRHENPADHHAIRAGLIETWNPQTPQEFQLIEVASSAYIRMQRVEAFETALFSASMEATQTSHGQTTDATPNDDLGCALAFMDPAQERAFAHMNRYRRTAHLDYHRALETLRRLQRDREEAPARRARAFKAQKDYLKATTATRQIPAGTEAVTPAPATQMGSIRKQASLRIVRPSNPSQNGEVPDDYPRNPEAAIE